MGFSDVAPGQRKVLGIRFLHSDSPFRCRHFSGAMKPSLGDTAHQCLDRPCCDMSV